MYWSSLFKTEGYVQKNWHCAMFFEMIEQKNHVNQSISVTLTCGGSSSENCTYFDSSTSQGTGSCKAEICKLNSDICQIRLDFR